LIHRLEYHLLGNHLFANAKALIYCGLYFSGPEAQCWYSRGLEIVARELQEQILSDGGHFELSTMYHAAAMEDLLDLVNIMSAYGCEIPTPWLTALSQMQRWLRVMIHPDGEIAFFNDAAFAVAPAVAELTSYAMRLGLSLPESPAEPVVTLEASGYVRAAVGRVCLLCDCAPVGPDYLPGHAHADTLSFEASLDGRRLFVNSGTSQYGSSAERQHQRSTAAHNTVVVDGQDSSEVWGGFRVARRARAHLHRVISEPERASIEASHDGYRRLRGKNRHLRRWTLDRRGLRIEDQISGDFTLADAYFHLHPEVEAHVVAPAEVILSRRGSKLACITFEGAARVELRPGFWHPQFGMVVPNHHVVARLSAAALTTEVRWEGEGEG